MRRMNSMELLHDKAAELIDAAEAFHYAADQTGIRPAVPVSCTERPMGVVWPRNWCSDP